MIYGGDNGLDLDLIEKMGPSWFSIYILYGGSVVLMVAQFKVFKLLNLKLNSQHPSITVKNQDSSVETKTNN